MHWAMATAHIGSKVSRRFVSGQLLLPHCHLPSCCCLACFTVKMTHPGQEAGLLAPHKSTAPNSLPNLKPYATYPPQRPRHQKHPLHQVLVQPQSRSPGEARGELAPLPPRRKCQITNSVIKIASVTSESLGGGGAVLLSRPPNARIFMILIFIIQFSTSMSCFYP